MVLRLDGVEYKKIARHMSYVYILCMMLKSFDSTSHDKGGQLVLFQHTMGNS